MYTAVQEPTGAVTRRLLVVASYIQLYSSCCAVTVHSRASAAVRVVAASAQSRPPKQTKSVIVARLGGAWNTRACGASRGAPGLRASVRA